MGLLFTRDDESINVLREVFDLKSTKQGQHANSKLTQKFGALRLVPAGVGSYESDRTHLQDFQLFRPRLAYIKQRMTEWKPTKLSQLLTPGYFDRLTWFTAVFGVIFGLIGALSLVTSIISIALAVVAWKYPV